MNLALRMSTGEIDAPALPGSLRVNRRLSQWLRFHRDGYVEVSSGKVEIGQGILTALAQIVAEELDIPLDRVRMVAASTAASPDEAVTSGSLSVQESGTALRHACAEARAIFREAGTGSTKTYWELADTVSLDREATGKVAPKDPRDHGIVGTGIERLDLPAKVFGAGCFIHDMELPGMLHARMIRPAFAGATLESFDEPRAAKLPGVVTVVRDGSFLGVIAQTEAKARAAASKASTWAQWKQEVVLPESNAMPAWLKAQAADTKVVESKGDGAGTPLAKTIKASYSRPYIAHASMAPSCALAQLDGETLRIWTHSQGIYNLRKDLALAFGMPTEKVVVAHVLGAGCYGHNGADDVAFDAARLAFASHGCPVRVQWSRADEMAWSPFGAAMAIDLEADLDAAGNVVAWRHEGWSNGHTSRPGRAKTPALLGAWQLAKPFPREPSIDPPMAGGGGAERNSVPLYDFPARHVVNHRVLAMPLRVSALRSLGAHANVFAIESFVDEIAAASGEDPVAWRLRHLCDPRARAVIERVVAESRWNQWKAREGAGRGIGFARYKNAGAYCAVVAQIEVAEKVRVRRLVVAVDVGLVVNPDGVANQVEGGAVQSASWALMESVRFDRERVTSDGWESYPILRCKDSPAVEVHLISRPDCPACGAGEAVQGPATAAIANALAHALGVRVRDLPFTPERIRAAIA
jgi:CO/xanthine dehydrogenase Mo-binding subunit